MPCDSAGSPTPSEAVKQAAEDAVATLAAALAALKDSRDVSCPPPTRQQVQAGAQLLRTEVAKVGLLYSQGGTGGDTGGAPTDEEATALLDGFQRAATALCMLYAGLAVAGGGPTLRASLHQTATSVVEACSSLIRWAALYGVLQAVGGRLAAWSLHRPSRQPSHRRCCSHPNTHTTTAWVAGAPCWAAHGALSS